MFPFDLDFGLFREFVLQLSNSNGKKQDRYRRAGSQIPHSSVAFGVCPSICLILVWWRNMVKNMRATYKVIEEQEGFSHIYCLGCSQYKA